MSDTIMWWPTLSGRSQVLHAARVSKGSFRSWHESLCGRPIGEGRGLTKPKRCATCRRALKAAFVKEGCS